MLADKVEILVGQNLILLGNLFNYVKGFRYMLFVFQKTFVFNKSNGRQYCYLLCNDILLYIMFFHETNLHKLHNYFEVQPNTRQSL